MPTLLDLPQEILGSIAAFISINVNHLVICKSLYFAFLPTFLGSIKIHQCLRLSANDIECFPPKGSPLYEHIRSKTKQLALRLVGHSSGQAAMIESGDTFLCSGPKISDHNDDNDDNEHETMCWEDDLVYDWSDGVDMPKRCDLNMQQLLGPWRNRINWCLNDFFRLLPDFSIDGFMFEAMTDYEEHHGWQWDYLWSRTIDTLLARVPSTVRHLTLDLSGSDYAGDDGTRSGHLCVRLAQCLMSVENVRLRVRYLCPSIFGVENLEDCPAYISNCADARKPDWPHPRLSWEWWDYGEEKVNSISERITGTLNLSASRLKNLTIKLNMPLPAEGDRTGLCPEFNAKEAHQGVRQCNEYAPQTPLMILAGYAYAKAVARLESLKLSFADFEEDDPEQEMLLGVDYASRTSFFDRISLSRGDWGECWDPWEDKEQLQTKPLPIKNWMTS